MPGPETNSSEVSYQLDKVDKKKELNEQEQNNLTAINAFLNKKTYADGKNLIEGKNNETITEKEKKIQEMYNTIKDKVTEKKTDGTITTKNTESSSIYSQNDIVTVKTSFEQNATTATLKNRGQKLGEAEVFGTDDKVVTEITNKIADALNDPTSDTQISIVGRSDANKFIWSERADSDSQKLLIDHKNLMNALQNDLPQDKKATLTMPAMPDKNNVDAMSDRLNTILAQARALKGLSSLKPLLGDKFKDFVAKADISIAPYQTTYVGEDRGVGILFSSKKAKEDIMTLDSPKEKVSSTEKEKKRYKIYQPVMFTYSDGKVYTSVWETDVQKTTTKSTGTKAMNFMSIGAKRIQTGKPGGDDALGMWYPNKKYEKNHLSTEENIKLATKNDPPRYGSYEVETTTTTTGIDKTTKQPKTISSITTEITPLAGDVVILPPIPYGSLDVSADVGSKRDGKLDPPKKDKYGVIDNWDQPYVNSAGINSALNKKMPISAPSELQKLLPNVPSYS